MPELAQPSGPERRGEILASLSQQTRAIALIALAVEAIFVAGAFAIPEAQRIVAFLGCIALLVIAIFVCAHIETSGRPRSGESESSRSLRLPPELSGSVIMVDQRVSTDRGAVADMYRTASNCKFAGAYEPAIGHYRKILEAQPDHHRAAYNIGSCLYYLRRYQAAEAQYLRLAEQLKENGGPTGDLERELLHGCYIQLFLVMEATGQFKQGIDYLHQSLTAKPDDAQSYLNLAIANVHLRKFDEARKWYEVLMKHHDQLTVLNSLSATDRKTIESLRLTPTKVWGARKAFRFGRGARASRSAASGWLS